MSDIDSSDSSDSTECKKRFYKRNKKTRPTSMPREDVFSSSDEEEMVSKNFHFSTPILDQNDLLQKFNMPSIDSPSPISLFDMDKKTINNQHRQIDFDNITVGSVGLNNDVMDKNVANLNNDVTLRYVADSGTHTIINTLSNNNNDIIASNNNDTVVSNNDNTVGLSNNDILQSSNNDRPTGIQVEIPKTPLGFVQLFVTRELLEFLTIETNRYAYQKRLQKPDLYKNWKKASVEELSKFIGLTILFGVFRLPSLNLHWKKGKAYSSGMVRHCLSRDRYDELNCFFHAYNNNAIFPNTNDRIIKIRTLKEYFINQYQKVYIPKRHLSIDEGMMPHKGQLGFKVYLPDKPHKYGIKVYMLCEADSGFVYNFDIYHGVGNTTSGLVIDLLKNLKNKGYFVFMDNFYNSVKLSQELINAGIHSCGTLRLNRGASKSLQEKAKNLKTGEIVSEKIGNVNIIVWQDKKTVPMITTYHDNHNETIPVIRNSKKVEKGKTKWFKTTVNKPVAVMDYNRHMNGVDKFDQMTQYYTFSRKSSKWTKKMTFYFFQMALFNAFCLYKEYSTDKKKLNLFEFHEMAYEELMNFDDKKWPLSGYEIPHAKDVRIELDDSMDEESESGTMFVSNSESIFISNENVSNSSNGNKRNLEDDIRLDSSLLHNIVLDNKRGRCKVCQKNKIRRDVKYRCESCNVSLCPVNCHAFYHKRVIYWKK